MSATKRISYFCYPFRIINNEVVWFYFGHDEYGLGSTITSSYPLNDKNKNGLNWAFREAQKIVNIYILSFLKSMVPYDNTNKTVELPKDIFIIDGVLLERACVYPDYVKENPITVMA
jgi:hypothetical protein